MQCMRPGNEKWEMRKRSLLSKNREVLRIRSLLTHSRSSGSKIGSSKGGESGPWHWTLKAEEGRSNDPLTGSHCQIPDPSHHRRPTELPSPFLCHGKERKTRSSCKCEQADPRCISRFHLGPSPMGQHSVSSPNLSVTHAYPPKSLETALPWVALGCIQRMMAQMALPRFVEADLIFSPSLGGPANLARLATDRSSCAARSLP